MSEADNLSPEPPSPEAPPQLNVASAPQRVEVVVENTSTQSSVNIVAELAIFTLRVVVSLLMLHHGLEKLDDPSGFSEFVVGKYFDFLPGEPIVWAFIAAITQLVCPVGLAIGIFPRLSALGLLSTMLFAIAFHFQDTGLEGFPFAVVENHNYTFELSLVYAVIFFYFLTAGPGRLSASRKTNTITYYPKTQQ